MSFQDQIANDIADVFLNTADFAESITYYPKGGVSRAIDAVVFDRTQQRTEREHQNQEEQSIRVFCSRDATDGIPTPQLGDRLRLAEDSATNLWDFKGVIDRQTESHTLEFVRSNPLRAGFRR